MPFSVAVVLRGGRGLVKGSEWDQAAALIFALLWLLVTSSPCLFHSRDELCLVCSVKERFRYGHTGHVIACNRHSYVASVSVLFCPLCLNCHAGLILLVACRSLYARLVWIM